MNFIQRILGKLAQSFTARAPRDAESTPGESLPAESPLKSLRQLRGELHRLGGQLGATPNDIPPVGCDVCDDGFHVEVHSDSYHYYFCERGHTIEHRRTRDLEQLLFWVASDLTLSLAEQFERKRRAHGEYSRDVVRQHQSDLMSRLGPEYALRFEQQLSQSSDSRIGGAEPPKTDSSDQH